MEQQKSEPLKGNLQLSENWKRGTVEMVEHQSYDRSVTDSLVDEPSEEIWDEND